MKTERFNIQKFLVENKLTEASRGTRTHFDTITLHQRGDKIGGKILSEMEIPVEGEEFEDEGGHFDAEAADKHNNAYLDENTSNNSLAQEVEEFYPNLKFDSEKSTENELWFKMTGDEDEWDFMADDDYREIGNGCLELSDKEPDGYIVFNVVSTNSVEEPLDEAGYVEDEDNFDDDIELDPDDMARARKAFDTDNDADFSEPEPEYNDAPEGDDEEFENPEQMSDEPAKPGLASQLKYDTNRVDFDMDEAELDEYLNGFRRPQVALKVLQRALNQGLQELDDSPAIKRLYLILDNGFYKTSVFRRRQVIATLHK